ncbi:hypothetical protein ACQY0O_002158 [Thecaphora frezii]
MRSQLATLALSLALAGATQGFQLDFPTASDYWVACGFNSFRWTAGSNDPATFSVILQNQNKTILNDDLSVANTLTSKQGQAQIFVPCVKPSGGYVIHFVNVSHYNPTKPAKDTYLTSGPLEIKANGTTPTANSHQTRIDNKPDGEFAKAATNTSISLNNASTGTGNTAMTGTGNDAKTTPQTQQPTTDVTPKSANPATGSTSPPVQSSTPNAVAASTSANTQVVLLSALVTFVAIWTVV